MDQFQKKLLKELGITTLILGALSAVLIFIASNISALGEEIGGIKGNY